MACKQRGTYAEIRNKLHCSGSGRIAQNPLTGPLSPSDGCRQEEKGVRYLFYLPTYPRCTLIPLAPFLPFTRAFFPYTIRFTPLPPTALRRLPFAHSDITRDRSLSLTVAPHPTPSHLSLLFHPLFLASRLVLFSRSSYLIGHFVLHRPRYYRGNSRTKRRATRLTQWCISAVLLCPVSSHSVFFRYRSLCAVEIGSLVHSLAPGRVRVAGNLEYSVHEVVHFPPEHSFVFAREKY